jgi:hypothetical protein
MTDDVLDWSREHLSLVRDGTAGLNAVIAVDNTTLGPGLGGVRLTGYPTRAAGIREAQRLARAMTVKNAVAGLPYGGAKAVILAVVQDRVRLMRRFGALVAGMVGRHLPGVDMGTNNADLNEMARSGAVGSFAETDRSPWTTAGVFAALRAARRHQSGTDNLEGVRVLVHGVGHVGTHPARMCADAGARLLVSIAEFRSASKEVITRLALGGDSAAPDVVVAVEQDLHRCALLRPIRTRRGRFTGLIISRPLPHGFGWLGAGNRRCGFAGCCLLSPTVRSRRQDEHARPAEMPVNVPIYPYIIHPRLASRDHSIRQTLGNRTFEVSDIPKQYAQRRKGTDAIRPGAQRRSGDDPRRRSGRSTAGGRARVPCRGQKDPNSRRPCPRFACA